MTDRNGPKCGAKRHGTTDTCTLPAGWGTGHVGAGRCRKHLGNSPNVARSAAREQAEAEARAVLAELDVRPVGNPLLALRRLAGQVIAWQEACARLVNKLEDVRYSGQVGGMKPEQLRAEVAMYQDAMRQSASVLSSLAKLDIDARLSTIEQRNAQLILRAMVAAFATARMAPEMQEAVGRTSLAACRRSPRDLTARTARC
jgi:hypothetical protein